MALDGTYVGLQASVADFLNRSDLAASIPDFIVLAESKLNAALMAGASRPRQMKTSVSASVSTQLSALPTDFLAPHALYNANGKPLRQKDEDALQLDIWQFSSPTGTPLEFAIMGTGLLLNPAPAVAQSVNMIYFQKIPALASNVAGNWLSLNYPGAYLFGALTAAAPYLQDDERLEVWGGLFSDAIADIGGISQWGARLTPQPTFSQIV
jgi:hypothetical protein